MKFRNAYSARVPSKTNIDFTEHPSQTIQEQSKATDINNILVRFQKTGLIDHVTQNEAQYGEFANIDYHTALNNVRRIETSFSELPASVRKQFDNNPQEWVEHLANPENIEDMKDGKIDNPVNIEAGEEPVTPVTGEEPAS